MATARKSASAGRKPPGRRGRLFPPPRTLILYLLLGGAGSVLLCAAALASLFFYYISDPALPTIDKVSDYRPKVVTRVLSRDGQLIGEIFEERRTVVPWERIPRVLIHAVVDAEDAQFFEHQGLNYMGMLRAVIDALRPGGRVRGASTITQQLVKTYVLKSDARTLKRKFQEMYLATRLERKLKNKEEILWIYLNQIYFGHGRYGVEEAARFYFGKSVSDVTLAEAALLASLPKGPEEISPRRNRQRAWDRRGYVLSQMVRYHHISSDEAKRADQENFRLVEEPNPQGGIAPEFVDEVERVLQARYGHKEIPYLGLNVRVGCDVTVQRAARRALEEGLSRLDERTGSRGRLRHLTPAQQDLHLRKLARDYPGGPPPGKIVEGVVSKVLDGDGTSGAGAVIALGEKSGWLPLPAAPDRYNPKGLLPGKRFAKGDVVRVRIAHVAREGPILTLENGPQGAVVAIDPETREVLALVGGYAFGRGHFNRALLARRQPGSAFKPFVYAAAFDSRKYNPASLLNDSPQVYDLPGMAPWKPSNAEKHEYLGPVRLRVALAKSLNTVASQLIYDLKPRAVIDMARSMGISSKLEENYALALGASEVTPLELTNAFATLAARGRRADPLIVLQVGSERPVSAEPVQAISPELAFLMTSALTSVIEEGTAVAARGKLRRPAAGKTGTTNSQRDAWFVGYTADLVVGVWVGHDDTRVLGEKEQGARAALPIWLDTMQAALATRKALPFIQPAGIVVQRVDERTGKLAAPGAAALDEVFLEGTAPTEEALAPGESDPNTFNMTAP